VGEAGAGGDEEGASAGLGDAVVGGVEDAGPGRVAAVGEDAGEGLPDDEDGRDLLEDDPVGVEDVDEPERF
jgi:hypothetical protein